MTAHSILLAADMMVAGTRGKGELEPWLTSNSPGRCYGAERAETQVSGRTYVSHETTVTQWRRVGDHHAAR